ncbi:hypothetical protein LguiA_001222 [Lonicera macranthoides]
MEVKAIGRDDDEKNIKIIRSVFGSEISEPNILLALSQCNNNPDAAINHILDTPGLLSPPVTVKRTVTSTGARISTQIKEENSEESADFKSMDLKPRVRAKEESDPGVEGKESTQQELPSIKSKARLGFEEFLRATNTKVEADDEYLQFNSQIKTDNVKVKEESKDEFENALIKIECDKETGEPKLGFEDKVKGNVKLEEAILVQPLNSRPPSVYENERKTLTGSNQSQAKAKPSYAKKERVEERSLSTVVIEDGDFPEEPDWLLVGRNAISGLSTTKGRKLENNEIVDINFPSNDSRSKYTGIVRFSTKRNGEIGRLPMEWGKCLIPLVNSSKVRVRARCVAAPTNLYLMQEILLYASFYIHHSVFTACDKSSWRLEAPANIDSTIYPLYTLFKLLKINAFQKAEFTPEELDSRKRGLNLEGDVDESASVLPMVKRQKLGQKYIEPKVDEQAISESSLNKLVGAADMYNLEEMEPPHTLMCDLRPYQKQALYWMSESEKGVDVEKAAKTLHPCWASYRICDERAPAIYVNIFSGEATTQFPTATQMARGGILADAMGLGKTVMTIALILTRLGKGCPDNQETVSEDPTDTEYIRQKRKNGNTEVQSRARGGTLIICPMALLSQWKDELETHSKPESISIFVHYGGDRSTDPKVIAEPDVVLTTYGVLTAAYKNDLENSIFHKVDWYRVVLDEAHTIKSSRTQGAQAAFKLSSHCRWCLTGTPLQNNLEDLYSLLCFLHVEPWCNWAWWNKLIQRPYENGDQRGLKLIKAILRPLMLRRTKDTKDKHGSRGDAEKYTDLNKLARRFLETNGDSSQKVPSRAYVEEVVEGIRRGENTECPICLESADDPVLTPCAHRMCRECLLSSWRTPSAGLCPICRQYLKKNDLITCPSENKFRVDVDKNWKESSKVSRLLDCLERVGRSGEKSIVFSQWTSFLDLLEIPLKRRGIGFLRFDGKLVQKNRERVLKEFNETGEKMETVEERMQQVQARKQRMISGALTDEEHGGKHPYSSGQDKLDSILV